MQTINCIKIVNKRKFMKNIITRGFFTASLSTVLFIGCADDPVSTDVPANVPTITIENTALAVIVKNTDTKELMNNIQVSFGGDLGKSVKNGEGKSITSASIQGGTGDFLMDSAEGDLFIQAKAEGFLTSSKKINIQEGANVVTLNLLPIATKSEIVEIVVIKDSVQKDGSLAEELVIESSTEAAEKSQVKVTIPADVKMTTATGKPIEGEINVSIIAADLSQEGALDIFPSSFTAVNSNKEEGAIITAGFTKIEIKDENGNKVTNFSSPIDVFIKIDETTINPQTNAVVKPGETIEVYSLSDGEEEWAYEGTKKIEEKDGVLGVIAKVDHLSYVTASFHVKNCGKGNEPTISIDIPDASFSATLTDNGYQLKSSGKGKITLEDWPNSGTLFTGSIKYLGETIDEFDKSFTCGENYKVTLPKKEKFEVEIKSQLKCQNSNDLFPYPSASVAIYRGEDLLSSHLSNDDGIFSTILTEGSYTYKVRNKWTGKTIDETFDVTGNLKKTVNINYDCVVGTGSVSL